MENDKNKNVEAGKTSFDFDAEKAARFKAGIDNLVNALGKASGQVLEAAKSFRTMAKFNKLHRAAEMKYNRENRTMLLRGGVQEILFKRDNEMYCAGCELEDTFCEGRYCEYQAETYWEQEKGRAEWKSIIYDALGDEYYNLSLRKKLELLKDLY